MARRRPCPVCGNWRWREGERPDAEGHHPDCGVNLRRRKRARRERAAWERRRQSLPGRGARGPGGR